MAPVLNHEALQGIDTMSYHELQAACKQRNLKARGKRDELKKRLEVWQSPRDSHFLVTTTVMALVFLLTTTTVLLLPPDDVSQPIPHSKLLPLHSIHGEACEKVANAVRLWQHKGSTDDNDALVMFLAGTEEDTLLHVIEWLRDVHCGSDGATSCVWWLTADEVTDAARLKTKLLKHIQQHTTGALVVLTPASRLPHETASTLCDLLNDSVPLMDDDHEPVAKCHLIVVLAEPWSEGDDVTMTSHTKAVRVWSGLPQSLHLLNRMDVFVAFPGGVEKVADSDA